MVAREEKIIRAAQLLHVTQPTLSRQLMQLEAELGVKLFRRGQHNITLTKGRLLKRRAQELANWFGDCYEGLKIAAAYILIYNAAIMVMDRLGAALCLRFESSFQGLRFVAL